MYKKPLYFLSDSTLCKTLTETNKKSVSISFDTSLLEKDIKLKQSKERKKLKIQIITTCLTLASLSCTLFAYSVLDEGLLGVCLFVILIGYLFFSNLNLVKSDHEYQESYRLAINIEQTNERQIFEILMHRIQEIIQDGTINNKKDRLEKIIRTINLHEDYQNKIIGIPIRFKTNIGELRNLFRDEEIPEWAQQFIQRHSMRNCFSSETIEELKKTPEEILA